MRSLPGAQGGASWSSDLVENLSFIKAKLRYPMKGTMFLPYILWGLIISIILFAAFMLYVYDDTAKRNTASYVMGTCAVIVFITIVARYHHSLKFITVHTGLYSTENRVLLEEFLKAQQMLVFRHPEAPEVFQIQSRNISAGNKEDREIVIFIADDNRVLINSHFLQSGWSFTTGKNHHGELAKLFIKFLDSRSSSTGLMHQTF